MTALQDVLDADRSGLGSPYTSRTRHASLPRQSRLSFGLHLVAFLVTFGWIAGELHHRSWTSGAHIALLFSSAWLLLGPRMVVRWYRLRVGLLGEVHRMGLLDNANLDELKRRTAGFRSVSLAVVVVPIILVLVGLAFGGEFVRVDIGIDSTMETFVAALVLGMAGLAAGYGMSCAGRTIVLALAIARVPGPFAPYAGVTSAVANTVAAFCFSAAMLFGGGGAVLLPAVIVCIQGSDGMTMVMAVLVLLIIICGTGLLLGVPAHFLSRRYTQERDDYLGKLSQEIDLLAGRAASAEGLNEAEYLRLRSLLELRSHVVQHAIAPPSVEMVKRMPLAVLVPLATTVAAWLAVFVDGKP